MKRLLLASVFAATAALAAPANAAIVHDTAAEFSSITSVAGTRGDGSAVLAARRIVGSMFDNNETTTLFSLGLGGSLNLVLNPATNRIVGGVTIERTNQATQNFEIVQVYLGLNNGGYVLVGEFRNGETGPGNTYIGSVTNVNPGVATLTYNGQTTGSGARTSFGITNVMGNYNSIRFVDISTPPPAGFTTAQKQQYDGFDIAELEVTSDVVSVPEPASMALLGAGLIGLGFAARRRKAG